MQAHFSVFLKAHCLCHQNYLLSNISPLSFIHHLRSGRPQNSASNSDPNLKAELECCLDENLQLRETLDRKKKELNDTQSE